MAEKPKINWTPVKFSLDEQKRKRFTYAYIMWRIVYKQEKIKRYGSAFLSTYVEEMISAGLLQPGSDECAVTEKGTGIIKKMNARYQENIQLLEMFDRVNPEVYGAEGFAINTMLEGEEIYEAEKKLPGYIDVRVAVAIFKGIDPWESVFYSQVFDGRLADNDWQQKVCNNQFWEDIKTILLNAYRWEQIGGEGEIVFEALNFEDRLAEIADFQSMADKREVDSINQKLDELLVEDGDGENVYDRTISAMESFLKVAAELMVSLYEKEKEINTEVATETTVTIEDEYYYTYDPYGYYDPFFVGVCFYDPFWDPWYDPYWY